MSERGEYVGYCYDCGYWVMRGEVRQKERDETCVLVCLRDGSIIDEHPEGPWAMGAGETDGQEE